MNVKKILTFTLALAAIAALVVGLSSCQRMPAMMPDAETPPMEETPPTGITIGVALGLTGPIAEPYGIPMQQGLELAREEINMLGGPSITFATEDTLSTADGAVAAVETLVTQGVPAVIGIGISTQLEQVIPATSESGVIIFSPISSAAGLSELGDHVFRAGLTVSILNSNCTKVTHAALDYKKAALIYDEKDTYSISSNAAFEETLKELGVEVGTVQTFQTDDTGIIDVSEQLTAIMEEAPDALFISALAPQMTQVITQARASDIPDTVHFIVPDLTAKEIQEVGAEAAEGLITIAGEWSTLSDAPGNLAFVQNYQTKYGSEPLPWAAQAYTTLYILAEAIKNAGSTDPAMIQAALAQTMDLPTILGNFSFDPNGDAIYDFVVRIVKDGELQPFGE